MEKNKELFKINEGIEQENKSFSRQINLLEERVKYFE